MHKKKSDITISLRKCSFYVPSTFFVTDGGPNWPFRCLDSEIQIDLDFFQVFADFISELLLICFSSTTLFLVKKFLKHQYDNLPTLDTAWSSDHFSLLTGVPTDLQDTAWESDHFSSLTGGPNWPFRCLDIYKRGQVWAIFWPFLTPHCRKPITTTNITLRWPPGTTAQCAVCKVYFSAQPNNLKPILNFQKYYPIEHIFVPACSIARKVHFFKF